jgi:hypothetical protein
VARVCLLKVVLKVNVWLKLSIDYNVVKVDEVTLLRRIVLNARS